MTNRFNNSGLVNRLAITSRISISRFSLLHRHPAIMSAFVEIIVKAFSGGGGGCTDGGYADSAQGREDQINAGIQRAKARLRAEEEQRRQRSQSGRLQRDQHEEQNQQDFLRREAAARLERERVDHARREREHQLALEQLANIQVAPSPADMQGAPGALV